MNEREDNFDIGIIGAGNVTERVHAPFVHNIPNTNIKYIADISERCIPLSNLFDTQSVVTKEPSDLPESDAVVLAIPLGVREPYLAEFSNRNVPVFVEKPFAPDTKSHEKYLSANDNFLCDYMRTCFANTRQLREIIEREIFGKLIRVNVIEEGKSGATGIDEGSYQTNPKMSGGGVIFERGCHTLSQIELIFGGWDWSVVDAQIDWNGDLDTEVNALIEFTNSDTGVPVSYRHSRSHPIGDQIQCLFEHATVVFNQRDPEDSIKVIPNSKRDAKLELDFHSPTGIRATGVTHRSLEMSHVDEWATDHNEAWYIRWRQFLSIIRGEPEPDIGVKTGLQTTQLITEIHDKAT